VDRLEDNGSWQEGSVKDEKQQPPDPARRGFVPAAGGGPVAAGLGALQGIVRAAALRGACADAGKRPGGTTPRCGGVRCIPNNRFLRMHCGAHELPGIATGRWPSASAPAN
jgi:hypothetical protein